MNERVKKLRQESLDTHPYISIERANLVTEAYKKYNGTVSAPVLRAFTFRHLLENKNISIGEGELIVGERGEFPQATPTFPELCCHSLEDLELINNRKKISFAINQEVKEIQKEKIIPYWENRSIVCSHVPAHPPRDFWEALQMYWFVHIWVITELNTWDSFNPERLDQHLYPFYKNGLEEGTLNQEKAKELLESSDLNLIHF